MLESRQSSDHGLKLCCCWAAQRCASESRRLLAKKGAVIRQFRFVKVNHFQRGLPQSWNARSRALCARARARERKEDAAWGHPRPPYEMINFTHHLGNSQEHMTRVQTPT